VGVTIEPLSPLTLRQHPRSEATDRAILDLLELQAWGMAPDCSICWRTSPAGREANRDRMARTRAELRQSVTTAAMATPLGSQ
jgi:hypothetical protein